MFAPIQFTMRQKHVIIGKKAAKYNLEVKPKGNSK